MNEDADKAAKSVLHLNETTRKIPFTDFKPVVNKYVMSKWQMSWDGTIFNKLHQIKPKVGSVSPCRQSRREDVVLTRWRIGHTFLTNSYLLKRECQPECVPCQEPLTVKHILVDCLDINDIRKKYYHVNTMEQILNVPDDKILNFLKEAGIFHKL